MQVTGNGRNCGCSDNETDVCSGWTATTTTTTATTTTTVSVTRVAGVVSIGEQRERWSYGHVRSTPATPPPSIHGGGGNGMVINCPVPLRRQAPMWRLPLFRWYASAAVLSMTVAVLLAARPAAGDDYGDGAANEPYRKCGTPQYQPLVATKGVITTPKFPGPFPVPIECEWVIQTSVADGGDTIIEVYFTQLFVTDGLTITEYSVYPPDFGLVTMREVFNKSHITQYGQSMLTTLPYLVIKFRLDRLEGNHIRVYDDLMDVYGFNITYEMRPAGNERNDVCSLYFCSYSGNCLGNADLS